VQIRSVRPAFLEDPLREIESYRHLLIPTEMGTPLCYGWHIDEPNGCYWLFLEKVPGITLAMVGDFEIWKLAARRLARLHNQLAGRVRTDGLASRLIRHDRAFYEKWLQRAIRFHTSESAGGSPIQEPLRRIAEIHPLILDELLTQPPAVIHGELYASHILTETTQQGVRVCAVDWERTAIGPAPMDVAALTAGNWPEEWKQELIEIYRIERQRSGDDIANPDYS
jgi:aminoglycoside/choline kinase family phosphotransferase